VPRSALGVQCLASKLGDAAVSIDVENDAAA
jgi:hypothetical protein